MKELVNPYFLISISIFIVSFISSNFLNDSYSATRIIISIILSGYLFFEVIHKKGVVSLSLYKKIYILLFVYITLQAFFSPYINTSFEHSQQLYIGTSYLLFITLFLSLNSQKYSLTSYLYFISIVSSIYILAIAISFAFVELKVSDTIIYYFKNIRFLNHLQTLIIPSLGLGLLVSRKENVKTVLNILLILNFMLLFETGGRGSLYAILFSYLFLYLTNRNSKHIQDNLIQIGILFVGSLILYMVIYYLFSSFDRINHLLDIESSGRVLIYKTVIPYIFDWKYIITAIGFSSQDFALYGFLHPHNLFLYIFLGAGSLGLILFILIFFNSIWKLLKEYFSTKSIIKRYLFTIFLSLLIHSLVSGLYITPLTSITALYLFLVVHSYYCENEKVIIKSIYQKVNILFVTILVVSIPYLAYVNYKLKNQYSYSNDEKGTYRYVPGIMLYSIKIFNSSEEK